MHFGAVAVSSEYAFAPVDDEAKEAKPFQWVESKPVELIGRNGQNGDPGIINLNPELCGHQWIKLVFERAI
jgi:hypothetical protein